MANKLQLAKKHPLPVARLSGECHSVADDRVYYSSTPHGVVQGMTTLHYAQHTLQ